MDLFFLQQKRFNLNLTLKEKIEVYQIQPCCLLYLNVRVHLLRIILQFNYIVTTIQL